MPGEARVSAEAGSSDRTPSPGTTRRRAARSAAPRRRTRGGSTRTSITVDSIPAAHGPASSTRSTRSPSSLTTCAAVVGESPWYRFALGAAIGSPRGRAGGGAARAPRPRRRGRAAPPPPPLVFDVRDERMMQRPAFGSEHTRECAFVERESTKAVDGLCGKRDQPAGPQHASGLDQGVAGGVLRRPRVNCNDDWHRRWLPVSTLAPCHGPITWL